MQPMPCPTSDDVYRGIFQRVHTPQTAQITSIRNRSNSHSQIRAVSLASASSADNATQASRDATSLESQPGQGQTIDSMLHEIHERVFAEHATCARLPDLYDQLSSKAGRVLDDELRFEDTPSEDRAIKRTSEAQLTWHQSMELAKDRLRNPGREKPQGLAEDGLVLVCHMVDAKPVPIASWSLGFVIKTNDNRHHVVSCSHTLESAVHAYRSSGCTSSSTFVATRAGALCPITSIASSLPLHDIVLYDFAPSTDQLHTVPVALHPPQSGNTQSLFSVADNAWRQANIIGYKDPRGNDAEPGTYDELNSISIDFIPTPGSSGGPLVSSNGAVTGLIRGSRMAYGERRSVGFATPAEKIFEMFQLPGLPRRSS